MANRAPYPRHRRRTADKAAGATSHRGVTTARSEAPDLVSGREAAVRAVCGALGRGRFVHETLAALAEQQRLAPREHALALNVALGAIRHFFTIRCVLRAVAGVDPRRTPRETLAILATGAYQLIWMDRVPAFAAVHEAVELARAVVGGRAPRLVNAVLRRLTGSIVEARTDWRRLSPRHVRVDYQRACRFSQDVLPAPDDLVAHLAAATGERPQRFRKWVQRHGPDVAESIAWASQAQPAIVLQRARLRVGADAFAARVRAEFGAGAELAGDAAFLPSAAAASFAGLFREGLAFVQDPTAHEAARFVGARPGERVLDLCAAPGGKSLVIAEDLDNRGLVLACDTSAAGVARIAENAARLGLDCIRAARLDDAGDEGAFDAAIVDAPCSNSGVLARRPEARLSLTPRKLASLVALQRELLDRAAARLRPGGRLIYSTCSIEPQENDEVVAGFARGRPDWAIAATRTTLPAWGARLADWHDGGYVAMLMAPP